MPFIWLLLSTVQPIKTGITLYFYISSTLNFYPMNEMKIHRNTETAIKNWIAYFALK